MATRIVAHTQVLNERVCFLAAPEPDALARALVQGLTDEVRREQVTSAAQELYEREYSRDSYVGKMRHLMDMLA